jgi:hypothetical protein
MGKQRIKKKSQKVWWHVIYTDDITDNINLFVKSVRKSVGNI